MSFSFLQCLLQVKKSTRENSTKYVNQTGNFYFRPKLKTAISLPIFNLFSVISFLHQRFHLDHHFNQKIENLQSEGIPPVTLISDITEELLLVLRHRAVTQARERSGSTFFDSRCISLQVGIGHSHDFLLFIF